MQALRKMPKPLAWEDIERTHKEFEPAGIRSPEDVMNDLDAPARRIRRLPAKTLSGDREARLAKLDLAYIWEGKRSNDPDGASARSLIEAVLELAVVCRQPSRKKARPARARSMLL
jgi:hypothetical protein